MTINGTLRNARRVQPGEDPRAPCLSGEVYGDTKGRFFDGDHITTSTIVSEEGDVFKTRYSAYLVESWDGHPTEDAFMVPGMGAQPVPPPKYVPANDNVALADPTKANTATGRYIGLTRPGDPNGCADDLVTTTFAPLEELPVAEQPASSGPYVSTATGRKFFPLSPRPEDVDIHHIARSMSMTCRYNGAVRRFYSTAEHSVHIARSLVKAHGKLVALAGLLHDAPESYSGFGDVVSPMKSESPFVGEIEDSIYRKAIAPRFGLDADIPDAVHIADMRIRGNEVANMVPMAWHEEYDDPLGVTLQYWSPAEAEVEFLETFKALGGAVGEVW